MSRIEDGWVGVADGLVMCLHVGTVVHELVQPKARYVRTSAAPVKGMIRRVPAGPPYHRVVCGRCGMWAADLYAIPTLAPQLSAAPPQRRRFLHTLLRGQDS